jgi:putative ABC transport system permease protein
MQVIPIAGMVAGNAMVAVGLCYNNMGQRFSSEQQQIQEKLSLGATPKMASARLIRDSIRAALIPTVDSAKTVGLVSLPGMMSGLIFAGIDPVKAIKYQIMVTFMLLSTASLSTIIAGYLTYLKFFNARHQLVVTQLKNARNLSPGCGVNALPGLPPAGGGEPVARLERSASRVFTINKAESRAGGGTSRPARRRCRGRRGSPAASCEPRRFRRLNLFADG